MRDQTFVQAMNDKEKAAWLSFVDVIKNFLGNKKAGNHEDLVGNMLSAFRHLGCKMSIKVHFLFSHLDKFPDNLEAVSDEQGERFHQDLMAVEERYQGRWGRQMFADYCWSIKCDCPAMVYKRKSYYRGICIIDNGASRRRTRNARFRARRADHSTTSMQIFPLLQILASSLYLKKLFVYG